MSELQDWKFRLAEPSDAAAFSKWSISNPLIAQKDIDAAQKKNNPTVVYFAVENPAGKVVVFAPVYAQMVIAHLGFAPESTAEGRKQAMQVGVNGIMDFAAKWGVREVVTLSKEEYPVAQWALQHGFDLEPRQLLKLDMNKQAAKAEEEIPCVQIAPK